MHGLTHPGQVRGQVIFAGRGLAEDFEILRTSGINPAGTIALIRYGGLYRGAKVKNAEDAGCVGALLYSDPEDDGKARGAPLPQGPWRPSNGIQRGSVFLGKGEARTPGWAATVDAPRLGLAEAPGLVGIPSLPISADNAQILFGESGRPGAPSALKARVELRIEQDPAPVWVDNILVRIEGAVAPDECILAGAHRDSWVFGAADNGSGITVLLETARILGEALRRGWQPERTLILAFWDAEEWGLVGSTEWVEENRAQLIARAVAYVNLDSIASGPNFGASCSPGLASSLAASCIAEGLKPPQNLGTPSGGGSDHVPFAELAGVETAAFGFHGGNGTYHSAYDTPYAVERFLDPDFVFHAKASRLLLRFLTHLADAGTPVDGARGWTARAVDAAIQLQLPDSLYAPLVDASYRLQERVSTSSLPHPHRFPRLFLPAGSKSRSLLFGASGYQSSWFPEVAKALAEGNDPEDAVKRILAALRRAEKVLEVSSP